jgi:predicted SpoU family rRNA methylase
MHISGLDGDTVISKLLTTVTVTLVVFEHPFAVPVTVYVWVDVNVAVTVAPVVELNPVAGLQL